MLSNDATHLSDILFLVWGNFIVEWKITAGNRELIGLNKPCRSHLSTGLMDKMDRKSDRQHNAGMGLHFLGTVLYNLKGKLCLRLKK